tara:strand:+ start:47076 stop:49508 length:2433 start_codon:yes stop_codon:yes gene_type:complete
MSRFDINLDTLQENALDLIESGIPLMLLHGIKPDGTCACGGHCERRDKLTNQLVDNAGKHPKSHGWQSVVFPTTETLPDWVTKNTSVVETWFELGAVSNGLGAVLPDDIVIIDVDCKDGKRGLESLAKLEKDSGVNIRELCGYTVNSGSGKPSAHYWFKKDPEVKVRKTLKAYPDIDFLHRGNYAVIEGSMHQRGNVYDSELARHKPSAMTQLPAKLIDIIKVSTATFSSDQAEAGSCELEDLRSAMNHIMEEYQQHVPYEDWFRICMALHFETGGSQEGYELFDDWSSEGSNYSDSTETYKKWQEGEKASSSKVTGGTIFHMAQELGWERDYKVDIDFSAFLNSLSKTPKTVPKNDEGQEMELAEMPEDLTKVNGIIGTLLKYSLNNSMKPSFKISLAAVIHEVSVIIGRDFRTNQGNFSNISSLILADTCQGKDQVKTLSKKVSSTLKNHYPQERFTSIGEVTSTGAIVTAFEECARRGARIDEFGHWLASATVSKDTSKAEVMAAYMELATSAHTEYKGKTYSQKTIKKEDRAKETVIERPFMSMICMTTPQKMAESVSDIFIKDGFLGRFLTWFPTEGDMPIELVDSAPLPIQFLEWVEMVHIAIAGAQVENGRNPPDFKQLDRNDFEKPLKPVVLDIRGVEHVWRVYELELMQQKAEYKEKGWDALLGRSLELAMRMALIFQVSENPLSKAISESSMRRAIALIKYLNKDRENFLTLYSYSNSIDKQVKELYGLIESRKVRGIDFEALLNMKPLNGLTKRDRDERIGMLKDNGSIIEENKGSGKGRPSNKNRVFYSTKYREFEDE